VHQDSALEQHRVMMNYAAVRTGRLWTWVWKLW